MSTADKYQVFYALHAATMQVRRHFDRRALKLGLTRAQWRALKAIGHAEGISQSDLAERLDLEPIAVGRVIDRLEKARFVERRADPADRRRWQLYLQPNAHAVVDEMETIAGELRTDAMRGIKRDDIDALLRVLAQMKRNLDALEHVASPELAVTKARR